MEIRNFIPDDYEDVYDLWKKCNLHLGKSDSREEIEKFLKLNPNTSLVGIIDGKIIGCVLGGFDGRRGLIHHLAVDNSFRKMGYGRQLINALEKIFTEMGVVKLSFWVTNDNLSVVNFYEHLGYKLRNDIVTMSKFL